MAAVPIGADTSVSTVATKSVSPISKSLSQKDEAYLVLERMIVTGALEPGSWVSEAELVELTGKGRAAIRSAIVRLVDQQLISVSPRRGAQICPIDFKAQFRLLELRRVVERFLVSCAAKRANTEEREAFGQLAKTLKKLASQPDQSTLTQVDFELSTLIVNSARNTFAARAMHSLKGLSRRFWVLYQEEHGDSAKMAELYAQVAATIAQGDIDRAEIAVDALIDYVEAFTLKVVGYSG